MLKPMLQLLCELNTDPVLVIVLSSRKGRIPPVPIRLVLGSMRLIPGGLRLGMKLSRRLA